MSLPGPSRTITVEPIERPAEAPRPAREGEPAPRPSREPTPAPAEEPAPA